jgi:hypothetical protein
LIYSEIYESGIDTGFRFIIRAKEIIAWQSN